MTTKMRNSKDYPVEHGPRQGETIIFLHGGFVAIELIRRHPLSTHARSVVRRYWGTPGGSGGTTHADTGRWPQD